MAKRKVVLGERGATKAELIRTAALRLFLEKSYDTVSIDLIAATAGVSKATVYAHFAGKEALFTEIFNMRCAEMTDRIHVPEVFEGDVEGTLMAIARDFVALFLEEEGVALYRLLVGEAHRFPEIARRFDVPGPGDAGGRLVGLIGQMTEAGALAVDDVEIATDELVSLLLGRVPFGQALGLMRPSAEEIERRIASAVRLFVAGYAGAGVAGRRPPTR
jgi:AcrR family transcriptional regulator